MMNDWGWMGGWGWGMGFGWIVVVVLAILVGWLLINAPRQGAGNLWERERRAPPEPSALEILERRYANGELSDEEFERMRQRLQRSTENVTDRPRGNQGGDSR